MDPLAKENRYTMRKLQRNRPDRKQRAEMATLIEILADHPDWIKKRNHFRMLARMASRILSKGEKA